MVEARDLPTTSTPKERKTAVAATISLKAISLNTDG